jgi:hypothetical protein
MIKINWDCINGCVGFGIIAKDSKCFVLVAWSTTKNIRVKQVVEEALSALHAAEFSRELRL